MAWAKLGTTTLGGSNVDITVIAATPTKFVTFFGNTLGMSSVQDHIELELGSGSIDTGTNYADRKNVNSGGESTATSADTIRVCATPTTEPSFTIGYYINIASEEKLLIFFGVHQNTAGAATAPYRLEGVGKWVNTSNQADYTNFTSDSAYTFPTDSNLTAIGTD